MFSKKKRDAAIDAAIERWRRGELPRCGQRPATEPCLSESGENIYMCHFAGDGTACKSCGGEPPRRKGCFSVCVSVLSTRIQRAREVTEMQAWIDEIVRDHPDATTKELEDLFMRSENRWPWADREFFRAHVRDVPRSKAIS